MLDSKNQGFFITVKKEEMVLQHQSNIFCLRMALFLHGFLQKTVPYMLLLVIVVS